MHIDLGDELPGDLTAEVIIIGSGAAGQTVARQLLSTGRSVILLESGGLDYESWTAELNAGRNVGQPYYDLEEARLRFFGGTTAVWGGRCSELDPIDFEQRPWIPWSGWPVTLREMRPYYDQAWALLGLPSPAQSPPEIPSLLQQFEGPELSPRSWLIDVEADRFGSRRNRDLFEHPRLTIVTHATVREICVSEAGGQVLHLDVRGPGGSSVVVRGKTYVLAAGGIENPRILLESNSVIPAGLGNEHDLVGRFFMEHPHGRGGRVVGGPVRAWLKAFQKTTMKSLQSAALLTTSPDFQRTKHILNSALTLASRPPPEGTWPAHKKIYLAAKHRVAPDQRGRALWRTYKAAGWLARSTVGPTYEQAKHKSGSAELAIVLRAEQAPHPESRVLLGPEVDALGMRQVRLDWRLQPIDRISAGELVDAFGREVAKLGLGRCEKADWLTQEGENWVSDPLVSVHPLGGYHHMGTTRMADDPRRGVTDSWGKVHGMSNLYIASSSLFPTGGWANPTITIIALALRTAGRINALTP